nr:EAL domain-containing protein [Pseudomonas lurida]
MQPVYDTSGTAILYSEALIRFSDERARIDTQRAISAFEKTGQIRLVDRYVLGAVIGRLQIDYSAVVACNISALSFNLDFWWESVLRVLRKNPSVANRLIIELAEGAAIDDHSAFIKFVKSFRSLGVRFALDDFGTGMPRAAAIKNFTFDYVKLDKSTIRSLSSDFMGFDATLNVVMYIQDAGSKVIAEGIESENDALNARRLGCSYMQGYYLGGPSSKRKHLLML